MCVSIFRFLVQLVRVPVLFLYFFHRFLLFPSCSFFLGLLSLPLYDSTLEMLHLLYQNMCNAKGKSVYAFHLPSSTSPCLCLSSPSMNPSRPSFRLSITFASNNPLPNLLHSATTQSVNQFLPIFQYSILLLLLSSSPF